MSYESEILEIENNKEMIARAISMGIFDGDEKRAREHYPRFLEDIKNTTVFFLKVNSFETRYTIERKKVVKELSDFVGYDTLPYLDKQCAMAIRPFFKDVSDGFIEFYKKNSKRYARYGIGYEALERLYKEEKIEELNKIIEKIDKYQAFKFVREQSMNSKERKELPIIGKQFDELKAKFKLSNLDDLLILGVEVESFLVDTSNKSEAQKKIIERNKAQFRKRIGAKEDFELTKENVELIKNQINQVYNFNLYRQALDNSNLKEFFQNNGFEYNGENLEHVVGMLMSVLPAAAICGTHEFENGKTKHCMYGAFILDKTIVHQNMIVTHEFIHALERVNKDEKPFWRRYCSINEAMTEYFALRAQNYLEGNVLSSHTSNPDSEYTCAYTNMLPLVEVLERSPYWNDFLDAKFNGNVDALVKKIGKNNMRKIRDIFICSNCLETNDIDSQRSYAASLEKLINKIYARRNK